VVLLKNSSLKIVFLGVVALGKPPLKMHFQGWFKYMIALDNAFSSQFKYMNATKNELSGVLKYKNHS